MSSPKRNGDGLDSDDQRNKVTGGRNETVPVSLGVPCEDVRTDEKLADFKIPTSEDQKVLEETIKLVLENQTAHEIDARLHLANLQAENQKLVEEVLTQTKKTNTALAMQSELYGKILVSGKSIDADYSEDVHSDEKLADLKKSTFENQKLIEETIKLARENQTSLEIDARLHLANLQAENQKLAEEVATQTKKNNTALAMQSELYEKILGSSKSNDADCRMSNSPETKGKLGGKRLLGQEETSEMGKKKLQKLNSEEDRSAEDQKD